MYIPLRFCNWATHRVACEKISDWLIFLDVENNNPAVGATRWAHNKTDMCEGNYFYRPFFSLNGLFIDSSTPPKIFEMNIKTWSDILFMWVTDRVAPTAGIFLIFWLHFEIEITIFILLYSVYIYLQYLYSNQKIMKFRCLALPRPINKYIS